jgi:hypothetical protein
VFSVMYEVNAEETFDYLNITIKTGRVLYIVRAEAEERVVYLNITTKASRFLL